MLLPEATSSSSRRRSKTSLAPPASGSREKSRVCANGSGMRNKVEQYRAGTNLFVGTNNTALSNQQLGDLNAQLTSARAQKADAEAKARIIRDALRSGP